MPGYILISFPQAAEKVATDEDWCEFSRAESCLFLYVGDRQRSHQPHCAGAAGHAGTGSAIVLVTQSGDGGVLRRRPARLRKLARSAEYVHPASHPGIRFGGHLRLSLEY